MQDRRPLAVVTGASSGLGREFAVRLAHRGYDLVVVARRLERLTELADELGPRTGAEIIPVPLDLADPAAPESLLTELRKRSLRVDALVNAAGFGTAGPFEEEDPARIAAEIAVDVTAPTLITRLLMPDLMSSPAGLLILVSSTASRQPTPNLAVYAASKAYVTSLASAIWQEARGSRLRVLGLCPGPTATEFFEAAGSEQFKVGRVGTIDEVIDTAFRAVDRRSGPLVTVGWRNRLQGLGAKLAPLRLTLRVGERATEKSGRLG